LAEQRAAELAAVINAHDDLVAQRDALAEALQRTVDDARLYHLNRPTKTWICILCGARGDNILDIPHWDSCQIVEMRAALALLEADDA
jgi:hypothetical protein